MHFTEIDLSSEFDFKTSRSSGKGGQNVNKVSTKVALRFDIPGSRLLSSTQKSRLLRKLKSRITKSGVLTIVSSAKPSQLANKKKVIDRFYRILADALRPKKKRVPTKPTKAADRKRLKEKKIVSEKKKNRASGIEPE